MNQHDPTIKAAYEAPRADILGTFGDLTRGSTGAKKDGNGASAGSQPR